MIADLLVRMRDPEDDDFRDVSHLVALGEAQLCADCGNPTTEVFTIPDTEGAGRNVCPRCARMCRAKVSIGRRFGERTCPNVATGRCSECGAITCTFHRRGCEFDHKRARQLRSAP